MKRSQVDLEKLKEAVWTGIPRNVSHYRRTAWMLLSDYVPIDQELKESTLQRKREEYSD